VVVLRDGRTVAELERSQVNQNSIMAAMAHGDAEAAPTENADGTR
jgi:ABC-type sugar transport system ATPase subunit